MHLLDTDTLVFLLRGKEAVVQRFAANLQHPRAMSVISFGELLCGALKSARPVENSAKVRHLASLMPVVDVSLPVVETYSALKADLDKQGNKIDEFDLLIAATALNLSYALVTNNERHFRNIPGLKIENWTS
jgi:tRNA(fMet)-specific endonuclease VapC